MVSISASARWNLEPLVGRRVELVCRPWVKPPAAGVAQGGVDPTMPESTCLHVQDRESGRSASWKAPWISVRISRACPLRSAADPGEVADEICRLQHAGTSWPKVPALARPRVPAVLGGRRLGGPFALPFDVPFRASLSAALLSGQDGTQLSP